MKESLNFKQSYRGKKGNPNTSLNGFKPSKPQQPQKMAISISASIIHSIQATIRPPKGPIS